MRPSALRFSRSASVLFLGEHEGAGVNLAPFYSSFLGDFSDRVLERAALQRVSQFLIELFGGNARSRRIGRRDDDHDLAFRRAALFIMGSEIAKRPAPRLFKSFREFAADGGHARAERAGKIAQTLGKARAGFVKDE